MDKNENKNHFLNAFIIGAVVVVLLLLIVIIYSPKSKPHQSIPHYNIKGKYDCCLRKDCRNSVQREHKNTIILTYADLYEARKEGYGSLEEYCRKVKGGEVYRGVLSDLDVKKGAICCQID